MLLGLETEFVKPLATNHLTQDHFYYFKGLKSLKNHYLINDPEFVLYYDTAKVSDINWDIKITLQNQGIKNIKRILLGKKERFFLPKLFIRQSTKQLISAYTELSATANNNLYMLTDSKTENFSNEELHFLNGYFNSSIATFLAQFFGYIRYFKGKQPQMKIADFIKMPIIEHIKTKQAISKIANGNDEITNKQNKIITYYFHFLN